jgi:acyl carrier protein
MAAPGPLERRIAALFAELLNVEVPSVDADLIATGQVDSLALVTLLTHLETEFGIRVSLAELEIERLRTVRGIAGVVAAAAPRGTPSLRA